MARKSKWSPRIMPEFRRDLIETMRSDAARLDAITDEAERQGMPAHMVRESRESSRALDDMSASYAEATLFWASTEMTKLAMGGALDVPLLTLADCPAPAGLMGFETHLPPLDVSLRLRNDFGPLTYDTSFAAPVCALSWRLHEDTVIVDAFTPVDAFPRGLRMHHHRQRIGSNIVSITPPSIPLDLSSAIVEHRDGSRADRTAISVLSLLAAAWTMMATPSVVKSTTMDTRTGQTASPTKPRTTDVSLIDLRPLRHVHAEHDSKTGRKLSVRHLVRGHWTQQPYGPGQSLRRLQWRAPYIKGPEGAPLKEPADRVMVWRR